MRERSRTRSADDRNIPSLPPVADPKRRIATMYDLGLFLKEYFPLKFFKEFCKNHLRFIHHLQRVVLEGGLQAIGMPRGQGKTVITRGAVVWAMGYGHRTATMIGAATKAEAKSFFDDVRGMFTGEIFVADFPEIGVPLAALGETARLAGGQTYRSRPTGIILQETLLRLPTVPGSTASGSTMWAVGLNGAIRGKNIGTLDGRTLRPDFIVVDDPQKDDDAVNPKRVTKVETRIDKSMLGLVGDGENLAGVLSCTVIARDDAADRRLDREIYPQWNGLRFKMIEEFPERMDLWLGEYARLRRKVSAAAATAFYKENRKEMDRGAVVDWPSNYDRTMQISRLERGMQRLIDDAPSFYSECQNEPQGKAVDSIIVDARTIRSRVNGLDRGVVPDRAQKLTAFADVHKEIIYWLVSAWDEELTGWIVDYGTFPKQATGYFGNTDAMLNKIGSIYPDYGVDGSIQAAILATVQNLIEREFVRQNGEAKLIDQIFVDSGYKPVVVEEALGLLSPAEYRIVTPSMGRSVRATSKPFAHFNPQPGLTIGHHWLYEKPGKRTQFHYIIDTNYYKTAVHEGFFTKPGNPKALTLWGLDRDVHRLFSDHCTAEDATLVKANGREIYEFFTRVNRPDNHWFDCLVGCMAAASALGLGPA